MPPAKATSCVLFILQAKPNAKFPAPYTTMILVCLVASIECATISAAVEHHVAAWSLRSGIRLMALYAGCICSAMAFCVTSWCIKMKGPLYTAVFTLCFSGRTLVGSTLIIAGLYSVLWGKDKEAKLA